MFFVITVGKGGGNEIGLILASFSNLFIQQLINSVSLTLKTCLTSGNNFFQTRIYVPLKLDKGIESLPQTQIFECQNLSNLMV